MASQSTRMSACTRSQGPGSGGSEFKGTIQRGHLVESTVGRFIFNEKIPQDLGFVKDREADPYSLEIDFLVKKGELGDIIDKCYRKHGNTKTALMLDYIKDISYHYSTKSAITIGISDMEIPEAKAEIIAEADEEVGKYLDAYNQGLISENERYEKVIDIWAKTTDKVADALMDSLDPLNNLNIMATSGARGSKKQIQQIGGMRGLMGNAAGKTVEIPIKANFREGLSVLDYFVSTNGARKGLADTALRTADSGYLTRRLVDVSHNIIVREADCGTDEGIMVRAFYDGKAMIESLKERIVGRTALNDIEHPETGEVICHGDSEITEEIADEIELAGIESVAIRSVLTCQSKTGICAKCYGRSLATRENVNIGDSVGIMAAQSIGEPGTQLTMRTFHTGGVAGGDITNGLPRVEELFEARKPKGLAVICEADGTVTSIEPTQDNRREVTVRGEEEKSYVVPFNATLAVEIGDYVEAGDNITTGPLAPADIFKYKGVEGVYQYLIKEVQKVYKDSGCRHQRQAHRSHSQPDAFEEKDRGDRRHEAASGWSLQQSRDRGRERRSDLRGRRAGNIEESPPRYHKGFAGNELLPVGGFLPGDDESPHRRSHQGQDGQTPGPEGERHHRKAHPGRYRHEALPQYRHRLRSERRVHRELRSEHAG